MTLQRRLIEVQIHTLLLFEDTICWGRAVLKTEDTCRNARTIGMLLYFKKWAFNKDRHLLTNKELLPWTLK